MSSQRPNVGLSKEEGGAVKMNADFKICTTAEAHTSKLAAERIRINVRNNPYLSPNLAELDMDIADRLETSADAYLTLNDDPDRGAGGEWVPAAILNLPTITQTINCPDRVSVDASLDRLELVYNSDVLNMALDAAEAIEAKNAAEQMLAHQMATAHKMSLDLIAEAGNTRDPVEKCRLVNTGARLMETYQKAMLTISRIRTGGQQIVTVQHVQVADGGKAVVNGALLTGGPLSGGGSNAKK